MNAMANSVPPTRQIGVQMAIKMERLPHPSYEKLLPTSAFFASAWRPLSISLPISA